VISRRNGKKAEWQKGSQAEGEKLFLENLKIIGFWG